MSKEGATPEKHHPFGFSSLYRRKECPASYFAEMGLEEETSDDAAEGIMLHAAVWQPEEERLFLDLDDEQTGRLSICDEWLEGFDGYGMGEKWHAEETLSLYDEDGKEMLFGTPDAFKILPDRKMAVLGDFKFGRIPVDSPDRNLQLAGCSAAMMQKYGKDYDLSGGVHAHIVQPRLEGFEHPGFVFRNYAGIVTTVQVIIERCKSVDAIRKAGSHCRYCKARHGCPEFGGFEISIATFNPTAVTSDNIAHLITACTQMGVAIDRARSILKQIVRDNDGRLGNVILKPRAGNREVSTSYKCTKCLHEWVGPQTHHCTNCDSRVIEQTGGGAIGLYEATKDYASTGEFIQRCKPNLVSYEALIAGRLKEAGVVATKKDGKALFNGLDSIIRGESSEVLTVVMGEG